MQTDIWRNKDSIIDGLRFHQEFFPNQFDIESAINFIERIEVPVLEGNLGYAVIHTSRNQHELIVQEHIWDISSECYWFANERVIFTCYNGIISKAD